MPAGLLAGLLAACALAGSVGAAGAAGPVAGPAQEARPRLVVAFVQGNAWDAPGAATGALVLATGRDGTCDIDVALTLSAGRRAGLPGDGCAAADWDAIVAANAGRRFGAVPGTLGATLAARGSCATALGPLAHYVAADRAGNVPDRDCPVHVVDLRHVDAARAVPEAQRYGDRVVLLTLAPRGHLGGVALVGERGVLRGSTRRDGLVTLADVHAHLTGERPLRAVPGSAADVAALARREHLHRPYHGLFYAAVITLPMLLYIWLLFGRRRAGPRARAIALALGAFPAAGFVSSLLPWWRVSWAAAAATGAVVVATFAVLGLGLLLARATRWAPEAGVAAVTAAVFAADLATGGYLQETGIGSYSAVAGGRFYGLGNAGFAILSSAAVVAVGAAAARWGARAWVLLVPFVAVVAVPAWGADFGGAITLTAALVAALAVRPRFAVLGAAGGLAVALAVALADYARPAADRTHLGRFVGELRDGTWTDTVARKAAAAAGSLLTWYPLLVAGSAAIAYVLLRRARVPEPMVRALLVLWVLGSLVNDSGVVVAAAGMAVAVPLLVSYAERP